MPFHKWVGSKRSIAEDLFAVIPKPNPGRALIVPFYGGGADSHWAIEHGWATGYILTDVNPELVNAHLVCMTAPGLLVEKLTALKNQCFDLQSAKEVYLSIRTAYPSPNMACSDRAAQFIFLVQCGFNGLWRENRFGRNNVPFGQRLPTFDVEGIFATSKLLRQAVALNCRSYEGTIAQAQCGDVVYCDPPYIPTSKTASFTSYTAHGRTQKRFDLTEHHHLFRVCLDAAQRGARVFVSNSDTEDTRRIYGCYREDTHGNPRSIVHTIQAPRRVSAKASSRGTVTELLIEVRP